MRDDLLTAAAKKIVGELLQPIETAPHNETDVLLFGKEDHHVRPPVVAGWYEKNTDFPGWYTYDNADNPIRMEPTHWMPLPEPA